MTVTAESTAARTGAGRAALSPDWWRGAVIYQIYPRSFADHDGNGVGDLQGITEHLEHVASLGVDAIWISPFYKSPMKDFGYDVSDYEAIDPIFGTMADFDRLVARAHELGLKVLTDLVFAHTSDQHAWFKESRASRDNPKADWFVWADPKPEGSPPSNWQSVFGGPAWTWDSRRNQYYMHNFLPEQPQLNVHKPEVQEALLDIVRFWLDRGVDGFRLDALNFSMHDPALTDNPPMPEGVGRRTRPFDYQDKIHNQSHPDIPAFLERIRQVTDSYGGRFTMAEIGGDHADEEMKVYTAGDTRLNTAYGFLYLYAPKLEAGLIDQAEAMWPQGQGWPSWTFSNHDAPRAVSRWAAEADRKPAAEMLLMLLMSLRGTAVMYQGEELGLPQAAVPFERLVDPEAIANWPVTLGRDGARTPMPWGGNQPHGGFSPVEPWLPVDERHQDLAVDRQEKDPDSTLHWARRVIALRHAQPVLRTGRLTPIDAAEKLIVFERGEGDARLLCVFNVTADAVDWRLPSGWKVIEGRGLEAADDRLPPYACLVAARA